MKTLILRTDTTVARALSDLEKSPRVCETRLRNGFCVYSLEKGRKGSSSVNQMSARALAFTP